VKQQLLQAGAQAGERRCTAADSIQMGLHGAELPATTISLK